MGRAVWLAPHAMKNTDKAGATKDRPFRQGSLQKVVNSESERNAYLLKRVAALENINWCLTKQLASANKHRVVRMLQWQEEKVIGACR
jgi:hypothetical protein